MNVVHIGKYYWPYSRGIETYLRLLCEHTNNRVNLDVLVSNTSCHTVSESFNNVRVTRLARIAELASTSFCLSLPTALRKLKPDIVHVHLPNPWAELCYFLAGCPGKLVVSFHSDIIRQRLLLQAHKPLHRAFLRRAAAVIAATPNHISCSPFLSRLDPSRLHVIPYGIDVDAFKATDSINARAAELRAQYRSPLILYVGHLVYYKGLNILLKALRSTDAFLVIAGTGPLLNSLQAQTASLGLADRVSFPGSVDQDTLVALLHACDVFCLPSTFRSEAFGIVQLEAFAAGKPVVSTNLPSGVPWVNEHMTSGMVVPPGDPPALAEALNRLLADDELRLRLGRQAYDRVRSRFTASRMADDTLAVYNTVMKTNN